MSGRPVPPLASPRDADRPLRISELASRIESVVRDGLGQTIRVVGEVSGAVLRTHWYFNAKDDGAVIACVMFASAARRAGVAPEDGREYLLTGRVEYYAKGGKVSFIVDRIEVVGEGALDLIFRRRCEELRALGWLDPERRRPLPIFPQSVAIVTSAGGAALQDVLDTMSRRCPAVGAIIVDVRVQGDRAADEVARAIRAIGSYRATLGVDAIIVTRGGGSKEDLWSFNERIVAEAIVHSPIPVVAAIGHETDITLAELVADERAATPTQAAMRLTPDRRALTHQVAAAGHRLRSTVGRAIRHEHQRLRHASRHPLFRDPAWSLARSRNLLRETANVLKATIAGCMADAHHATDRTTIRLGRVAPSAMLAAASGTLRSVEGRLPKVIAAILREQTLTIDASERHLESVGPRSVLGRGYSWTRAGRGQLVRSVADVVPGETLRTQVIDGLIESVVGGQVPDTLLARLKPPEIRRSRLSPRNPDTSQLGLFCSEPDS